MLEHREWPVAPQLGLRWAPAALRLQVRGPLRDTPCQLFYEIATGIRDVEGTLNQVYEGFPRLGTPVWGSILGPPAIERNYIPCVSGLLNVGKPRARRSWCEARDEHYQSAVGVSKNIPRSQTCKNCLRAKTPKKYTHLYEAA